VPVKNIQISEAVITGIRAPKLLLCASDFIKAPGRKIKLPIFCKFIIQISHSTSYSRYFNLIIFPTLSMDFRLDRATFLISNLNYNPHFRAKTEVVGSKGQPTPKSALNCRSF